LSSSPFANLESWLAQFSAAAVRTQEIFDRAWQQELDHFQAMASQAPPESKDLQNTKKSQRIYPREFPAISG
jgi:hypothetical protein